MLEEDGPPDFAQPLGSLLELNRHGRLDQTGLRIRLVDLALASESKQGSIIHSLEGNWGSDRVCREKCDDLLSHRPDRVFSPKSHRCRFYCCRCQALGVRVSGPQLTSTFPTDTAVHARSVVLVRTSWSELALQEMVPRAKPASLLPFCSAASSPARLSVGC